MLLKRAAWFWKRGLVVISLVMLFGIGGVVIHFQKKLQLGETENNAQTVQGRISEVSRRNYKYLYKSLRKKLQRKISYLIWKQFAVL